MEEFIASSVYPDQFSISQQLVRKGALCRSVDLSVPSLFIVGSAE